MVKLFIDSFHRFVRQRRRLTEYDRIVDGVLSHTKVENEKQMIYLCVNRSNRLPYRVKVIEIDQDGNYRDVRRSPDDDAEILILITEQVDGSHHFACFTWCRYFPFVYETPTIYIPTDKYERDRPQYEAFIQRRYGREDPHALDRLRLINHLEPHHAHNLEDCSCEPLIALAYAFYLSANKIPYQVQGFPEEDYFHIELRLKIVHTMLNGCKTKDFKRLPVIQHGPFEDELMVEIPVDHDPFENVPFDHIPIVHIPAQNAPAQDAPAQNDPAQNDPVQNDPLENGPIQNDPLENGPVQNDPLENVVRIENVPNDDVPVHHVRFANLPNGNRMEDSPNDVHDIDVER